MKRDDAGIAASEPASARLHAILRFAVGVTVTFIVCELAQWTPTFLAPVLAAALLANIPIRPPLKMILGLIATMAFASLFAFALASLLRGMPMILFGLIALCMFLAFYTMLIGGPKLPALLLLICLGSIPVLVMIAPAQAGLMPVAMIRGIALALVVIWLVHLPWPRTLPPAPPPEPLPPQATPLAIAVLSTAVVVPLMLAYLMFGLADALPVMIATVMLVVNFDLHRSRLHATAMIVGNFVGGLVGLLVHTLLQTTPTLLFLALLVFLVMLAFAHRIATGGPAAAVALIACNAMLIILGSAISSEPGSFSIWVSRLLQFTLAGMFAVGMMNLIWYRAPVAATAPPPGDH